MSKATFYIRIDSYWQNSPDYFVGPFESRDEAQEEIERAIGAPNSLVTLAQYMAQDVKSGIRINEVLSKTAATRAGMRREFDNDNTLSSIPINTQELMHAVDLNYAY